MILRKLINWYFSKSALPYWCLFLLDLLIVFLSALGIFWMFNRTGVMFVERFAVLYTALTYSALSSIGALMFKTYTGVIRYSSFVDLIRVAYANGISLLLALAVSWIAENEHTEALAALNQTQTVIVFVVSTLIMGGVRVVVKTLYDVTASDKRALGALVYGALTGVIGIAKSIRSQNPRQFVLRGFISQDPHANHFRIMGEKVYNVDNSLNTVIEKKRIEAVLVSSRSVEEFRNN